MKALCYHGPRDIRYESFADASLKSDTDVLVKMEKCGICGSDLHIYHGEGFSPDLGFCVGHEAVGEVVEVGRSVKRFRSGDKVMLSAAVGCGSCAQCLAGHIALCLNNAAGCYGLSHHLEGCQAEAIRVPQGDFNLAPVPEGLSMDQALMLTDALPTAYFGCRNADIAPGKNVAVVGLGPIGLMAVEAAFVLGAARVFAIDLVAERRAHAAALGAIALDPADAPAIIKDMTHGRGVESVVEAVGHDVTISLALKLAAREGTVSVIGVNQTKKFDFPMGVAFAKGLTFRIGTCSVQNEWPELVPLLQSGRLHPEKYITHELPLSDGAEAYRLFDARTAGALKMILVP